MHASDTAAPEPTAPEYSFSEPVFGGALTESGDTLTVTFTTHNNTGEDDCRYPIISLATDATWLAISPDDFTFYCGLVDPPSETTFTLTLLEDRAIGTAADVEMRVSRLHCDTEVGETVCPTHEDARFTVRVDAPTDADEVGDPSDDVDADDPVPADDPPLGDGVDPDDGGAGSSEDEDGDEPVVDDEADMMPAFSLSNHNDTSPMYGEGPVSPRDLIGTTTGWYFTNPG